MQKDKEKEGFMPSADYTDHAAHLLCGDAAASRYERLGTTIAIPKNCILHQAGDRPDACYWIKKGRVMSFEYTAGGEERIYNIIDAGSLLLEANVLLHRPLTLSFLTLQPCILVRIPGEALFADIASSPEAALDLLQSVSGKFLSMVDQVRDSSNHNATWNVCNMLLILAERYGAEYDGKILINERISQKMLAGMLRINRVTVVRIFSELKNLGMLEQINGYYCIRSEQVLRKHMRYVDMQESKDK